MKVLNIIVLLLIIQNSAQAATIRQLLNDQNLAIVELKNSEKIMVGENFIISENKNQCLLSVINVDQKIVTVSSKDCIDKSNLTIGKHVEKSLFDPNIIKQQPKVTSNDPSDIESEFTQGEMVSTTQLPKERIKAEQYGSLAINYVLSPKIVITSTIYSGSSSEVGTLEYNFDNAFKFGFEWSQFARNSWNNGFLIDYTSLKFSSFTLKGVSASTTSTITGGMTLLTVGYSGKYRWEQIYLPVNLGIASSTVDSTGSFTRTVAARTFASLGIGVAVNEKFNLELTSSAYGITAGNTTSGTTTLVPSVGYLSNLQLNSRILF